MIFYGAFIAYVYQARVYEVECFAWLDTIATNYIGFNRSSHISRHSKSSSFVYYFFAFSTKISSDQLTIEFNFWIFYCIIIDNW